MAQIIPQSSERERATRALAAVLVNAIEDAQAGDPWPYIRLQWGDELVLDSWQQDLISAVFDPQTWGVFAKGNTGCGKGGSAAIAACAYFGVWQDAKVVITRDTYPSALKIMFGEVVKWWHRMRLPPSAMVQTTGIVDPRDRQHEICVRNPSTGEGFSGVHGQHILFLFDEATAIPDERFDLAGTQATKLLCLANPRTTSGRFRQAFKGPFDPDKTQTVRGRYGLNRLITIGGADCLNVRMKRLEKPVAPPGGIEIDGVQYAAGESIPQEAFAKRRAIIPGQTCYDTWMGHCQHSDPRWVRTYAHGLFPDEDAELALVRRAWLDEPATLWRRFVRAWGRSKRMLSWRTLRPMLNKYCPVEALGLDVAASTAGDSSVLTVGGRRGVRAQHRVQFANVHHTAMWVIQTLREVYGVDLSAGEVPIAIDCDGGYGLGVSAKLREHNLPVIEIHAAVPAIGKDPESTKALRAKYRNFRAQLYGQLGERLDPVGPYQGQAFMLPDDEELWEEITAHEKVFRKGDGEAFLVTPKSTPPQSNAAEGTATKLQTVKEKIGRSPDSSDSLVYFWHAQLNRAASLESWLDAGAF